MNTGDDFKLFLEKLVILCAATNATVLFESKIVPPSNASEKPFMRFIICDEHGKVLVSREVMFSIVAACELTLRDYQNYILEHHIPMNIPVDLGGQTK